MKIITNGKVGDFNLPPAKRVMAPAEANASAITEPRPIPQHPEPAKPLVAPELAGKASPPEAGVPTPPAPKADEVAEAAVEKAKAEAAAKASAADNSADTLNAAEAAKDKAE